MEADRVAVGHSRDDQAETFLLRLLRGAGPGGLGGIRPQRGLFGRPLLEVSRHALRDYLRERGVGFRDDETNLDTSVPRNRVRHELIPYLDQHFSKGISRILSREAALARADAEYLDGVAALAAARIVSGSGDAVEVDVAALATEPPAIGRRVARQALMAVSAGRFIGYTHVASVMDFSSTSAVGARIDLPGVSGIRTAGGLRLSAAVRSGPMDRAEPNYFRISLSIPGEALLPLAGARVTAEPAEWPANGLIVAGKRRGQTPDVGVVDASELSARLMVRARQPGDRFRPLGLHGRKKLHDFFVDRKVPRSERDRVPIVVDDRDRIVWVAGHAIAEEFRVTAGTKAVVILRLTRLE
jgi:tRNA(Ile)-lysidine synthase